MERYSTFIFEDVEFNRNTCRIILQYSLDHKISFVETLQLPTEGMNVAKVDTPEFQAALLALHLIGGVSYYKTCLPRKILIKTGELTKRQTQFWNAVYENGLGEFFFRNNIDFRNMIAFPASKEAQAQKRRQKSAVQGPEGPFRPEWEGRRQKRFLVPIGGGKDSIVTLELLKKSGAQSMLLRMEPHPIIDELAHIAGLPMLTVRRSLSPTLFDLSKEGALNGHVPITAYVSILSILIAILYDFDAVVMSNEGSASYGNVRFHGREINHQWSKSLAAEKLLAGYTRESIATDVEYFSLLRPLTELHVTKLFCEHPKYFNAFTSCNKNWKIAGERSEKFWCGTCPKCAFVFALMAAFLDRKTLKKIFGKDLFADEALLPLYRQLLGIEGTKPFECVGTPEETQAAFLLCRKNGEFDPTAVMKMFVEESLSSIKDQAAIVGDQFRIDARHVIPKELQELMPH